MNREIKNIQHPYKKKEIFNPIIENHVGMYVCKTTVYGDPHLGHSTWNYF